MPVSRKVGLDSEAPAFFFQSRRTGPAGWIALPKFAACTSPGGISRDA